MRTVVHLSDLHFGRLDAAIMSPLLHRISSLAPDIIAISGDLTQRARRRQFRQARAFLDALRVPTVVVPGNHDVPLFNLPARFLDPFGGYRRHVSADLEPFHIDDEIAVVGLNSARGRIRGGRGRLNPTQVEAVVERLRALPSSVVRIVVTHHPFDLPEGGRADHLIGRASMAMSLLATVGADLFLAGHLHVSHIGHTAARYNIAGHSAVVVQAGTLSTRGRGELNTFNAIRLDRREMHVDRYSWKSGNGPFTQTFAGSFRRSDAGWTA